MEENKVNTPLVDDVLRWHFFNMYRLSLSDEEFDFTERQLLYEIGVEHGITPEQINEVILTANLVPAIPDTIEGKVECLYDLARMAWADGEIKQEERDMMRKCVIRYGFLPENADGIVDYFIKSVKENKPKIEILHEVNG